MGNINYTINFVDPSKSTLNVLPQGIAGPSGGDRQTDIDLIGMGHQLWGEGILENFVHLLENFSCNEDIHPIKEVLSSNTFTISGDVTLGFPGIGGSPISPRTFNIWDSDNNDGSYTVESSSYDSSINDETTITISTSGSPALPSFVPGGSPLSLGNAGQVGIPDQSLKFSPITPVQGQLWYNQSRGQVYVYELLGSPPSETWNRVGGISVSTAPATIPAEGDLWWETTPYAISDDEYDRNLHVYIAGIWNRVSANYLPRDGSKVMQGNLDMDLTYQIINLADPTDSATGSPPLPTSSQQAVTAGWADDRYINATGDTITGFLTLLNDPIDDQHAATKAYVMSLGFGNFVELTGDTMTGPLILSESPALSGSPVLPLQAATKEYVDDNTVATAGDTMDASANLSFNGGEVLGLPVVPSATGATSKEYVDDNTVASAGDTMTGPLILDADPTSPLEAATKQYIDALVDAQSVAMAIVFGK